MLFTSAEERTRILPVIERPIRAAANRVPTAPREVIKTVVLVHEGFVVTMLLVEDFDRAWLLGKGD